MKKILATFLALVTLLSVALVACQKKTPVAASDDEGDEGEGIYVSQNNGNTTTGTDDSETGGKTNTTGWKTLTDTKIYVMADDVNVRSDASKSGKILTTADLGAEFNAISTNDSWYKISYGEEEAYISASFVTTNVQEVTFKDFAEADYKTLVVDQHSDTQSAYTVNLRTFPSLDEIGVTVDRAKTEGGQLVKVGENEAGNIWKVKYTPTAGGASKIYYIGGGAFLNFDGQVNEYGQTGSSRG